MGKKRRTLAPKWQYAGLAALAVLTAGTVALAIGGSSAPEPSATAAQAYATGSALPTREPILKPIPAGTKALVIGDSYTLGTGATDKTATTWAARSMAALGWKATIQGDGGTGFTWGGGADGSRDQQFINRINKFAADPAMKPGVVVLQGGQNDHRATPEELTTAVTNTVTAAKKAWPDAQVIIVGPTAPQPLASKLGRIANPISRAAAAAGAAVMNPVQAKWFTMENSPGFDFDKSHVNDAGHAHMAEQFVAAVKAMQS